MSATLKPPSNVVAYAALYVKGTIVELNALGQMFIKRLYGICYYLV